MLISLESLEDGERKQEQLYESTVAIMKIDSKIEELQQMMICNVSTDSFGKEEEDVESESKSNQEETSPNLSRQNSNPQ